MFVHFVTIPVADQARAKAFYVEKLGFEVCIDVPGSLGPGRDFVAVAPKGCETMIVLSNWYESMPPGSLRGLVFEVPDIDAEIARLEAAGVVIDNIRDQPWARSIGLTDSEGNGLVIQTSKHLTGR